MARSAESSSHEEGGVARLDDVAEYDTDNQPSAESVLVADVRAHAQVPMV
jgi:hypothetical protein